MDWNSSVSFLIDCEPPAAYTSAQMEPEPGALPLDILLIAFTVSACPGEFSQEVVDYDHRQTND